LRALRINILLDDFPLKVMRAVQRAPSFLPETEKDLQTAKTSHSRIGGLLAR
jgi:hypothetical protein